MLCLVGYLHCFGDIVGALHPKHPNMNGKVHINKKLRHCHFSILYNEIDFLQIKLPFLYEYFDQIIFYDLSAFNELPQYSTDGSHEYIKNYPDPEKKVLLIENKNLDNIQPLGYSNIIKQKMFSYGSLFVKNDIDIFWCTDMDEFFKPELIEYAEEVIGKGYQTVEVPHYYYFKTTDFILSEYRQLTWIAPPRICKHTKGNKYGHCSLREDYPPTCIRATNHRIFHLSLIGKKRIEQKFNYYLNNSDAGDVTHYYIFNTWSKFNEKEFEQGKDESGFYGYPAMHPNAQINKCGVLRSPVDLFIELPYLDKKIIRKMNDVLYLNTHTQFGDHCICYGLVKQLAKDYATVYLFTKPEPEYHVENVRRLYKSIKNVIILIDDPKGYDKVLHIGWGKYFELVSQGKAIPFDRYFYEQAEVPFEKKWDNFFFKRDMAKEMVAYYKTLGLKQGEKYIFLQEDQTRGYEINRKYIPKNIKIIESANITNVSILDLLTVIERAEEIHVINSSFLNFIDLVGIKHDNLYYHKYTRPKDFEQPALRLNWTILKI
jgi:hypothetical protein